ncbi:hypothetical protein BD410DRAFT_760544 [Rickenella mellea]|uniref:Rho-GAP domain-containing protein n=1 Tax=Rickenella mellea TaxID=50990 RepID=A0A4Y7QMH6_9AGAM|nr:hypothetical protein BD410DRAFT_760544 [Rickenella mellea]
MAASSSENVPTSRPSTSDQPQQGPINLFDQHLKVLSDSYLSFFQERVKIEEIYVESLLRLHRKIKAVDSSLDLPGESTTVRRAWIEVRDNVEREAQTREFFHKTLVSDVINPLLALKETQDRTRKRIKEDIKDSTSAHMEYAESTLPRLKRNYLRKCQEVEDYKAANSPTNMQPPPPPLGLDPLMLANARSNPPLASPPIVTSPQPLRPLSRRPSQHQAQPRNRSPSASNPLQEFAHQGKKQLNQLMTFLDTKGGTVKDGLGGVRGDAPVRTVRAKRDAEEADREYRKGVHWLETLRIRRVKILEGAFKSLELFIAESGDIMKKVLDKYADNTAATSGTQTHLTEHVKEAVSHISSQKDVSLLSSSIPRYLQQSTPRRTLYHNFRVGDCQDLIFGVGLVDYAHSRALRDGDIPKIVRICVSEVDKRGLNSEGVYRVSGRHAIVQDLMHKIERDERSFHFQQTDDIFVVASLLKQYLRELPEPVFKFPLEDRVKHTEELEQHVSNNFVFLRGKIRRLPAVHQATLKTIVEHLARVAAHSEKNKMDPKNLAIIFAAVIFGEDEMPKNGDLLSMQNWKDSLMEDLIIHANKLFDDKSSTSSSPPLPPAPAGEPILSYGYGSSYTQFASMPPRRSTDVPHGQDFTPQLPPRPSNSIHPSRRSNAQASRTGPPDSDDTSTLVSQRNNLAPPGLEGAQSLSSEGTGSISEGDVLVDDTRADQDIEGSSIPDGSSRGDTSSVADSLTTASVSPTPLRSKPLPKAGHTGDPDPDADQSRRSRPSSPSLP